MGRELDIKKHIRISLVIGLIYLFYYFIFKRVSNGDDMIQHIEFIEMINDGRNVNFSHLGYHYLVIIISNLININYEVSSCIVLSFFSTLFFWFCYKLFKSLSKKYFFCISFVVIGTSIYNVFTGYIYLGQFSNIAYHNPTFTVSRIIGIICTYYFFKYYKSEKTSVILLLSMLMGFQSFVKPNFSVVFFAALFFLFVESCIHRSIIEIRNIILFTVPSVLITFILIIRSVSGEGLGVELFKVANIFTNSSSLSLISIIFSVLGPLCVIISIRKSNISLSRQCIVSICSSIIGIAIYLFLFENGERFYHANYAWCMSSGYSLLYFYSSIEYVTNYAFIKVKYRSVTNIVLLLHILSGIIYILKLIYVGNFNI